MRSLLAILILCGCSSSPPAKSAGGKPASCANGCMNAQATCTDKCLEDDHPEGEESCAEKCQKAADDCNATCK
ncbi:MAG: hypothetical protein ACXVEF_02300 [Polyangiales bacterium]